MFSRFTHEARTIVVAARDHARRLEDRRIDTDHLLLALATEDSPVRGDLIELGITSDTIEQHRSAAAARRDANDPHGPDKDALASLGIDLDEVRDIVEQTFGTGALERARNHSRGRRGRRLMPGNIPFTIPSTLPFAPSAKHALEASLRESLRLRHSFLAPAHIGLAILDENAGVACEILTLLQVPRQQLRIRLEASLKRAA